MRVCLLFPYYWPHFGGVERVIHEVSKRLSGHEVHVVTSLLPGTRTHEKVGGVSIHRLPSFLPERIPYPVPKKLGLDILSEIKAIDPDILVTHNVVSFYTPVAVIAKLLYRKPLVLVMHTTDLNYGVGVFNTVLRVYYVLAGFLRSRFDVVAAPMRNRLFRLAPDVIIPNGVDRQTFRIGNRIQAKKRLGLPLDKKIVLFVGRFIPVKGVENLVRIINSLDDATFVLVGEGYLEEDIRRACPQSIIREPTQDVYVYYQAADACIIPSLAEGFCLTAIEAYACGVPVVGSDVGILPEITKEVYNPEDFRAMRDALKRVLKEPPAAGSKYKVADWGEIAKAYAELFEKTVEKRRSAVGSSRANLYSGE